MGLKHKKTRKEKIIADYRHQVYILKNTSSTDSVLDTNIPLDNSTPFIATSENSYFNAHVLKDVLKTTILTCSIVTAEIILFFLLQKHILTLPIVKY